MAFRVKDAAAAYKRCIDLGAKPVETRVGPMELQIPAIEGIGGSLIYLVDRYGMYRARMVLDELSSGADPSRAVNNALLISLQEFERGWKRSLE